MLSLQSSYEALALTSEAKKKRSCKLHEYTFKSHRIISINCQESAYLKTPCPLPTLARGLFIALTPDGKWDYICARGYDKFFNVTQVKNTQWDWIKENCESEFECTVKENGCIVFISQIEGDLLVTSKHCIGGIHANKGTEWVHKHLKGVGKSISNFISFLKLHNVTLVFELADDEFEEYPPGMRGLYLHGINENKADLSSWPSEKVKAVAQDFGFKHVAFKSFSNAGAVREFTDECRVTGSYEDRAIEGWVVRGRLKSDSNVPHFFKVKYDEPYLMFREWREVTKSIIKNGDSTLKTRYPLTTRYITFVKSAFKRDPKIFNEYLENKGIIRVRNMFLAHAGLDFKGLCASDLALPDLAALKLDNDIVQTLIVPMAPPTSGKSRLAKVLGRLLPSFDSVEFDEMTGHVKKRGKKFLGGVLASTENFVYADRHNHRKDQRDELIASFMAGVGGGECNIVVVAWDFSEDRKALTKELSLRVLARKRHPILHAGVKEYERNVASIVHSLEAWDERMEDKDIVTVRVNRSDAFLEVVKLVLVACEVGSNDADIIRAIGEVESEYLEYQASEDPAAKECKVVVKKERTEKAVRYIGIVLDESSANNLKDAIRAKLEKDRPNDMAFYESLKSSGRDLHVTLALNPTLLPGSTNARVFKSYLELIELDVDGSRDCKVYAKEIVWNDRVMCVSVDCGEMECCNERPHCTVGVVGDAKGSESNGLLVEEGKGARRVEFDCLVKLQGTIRAVKY